MIGKKFTNLLNGRVVEVKDMFEDIIILDDNSKLSATKLMNKSYYEEYIDPSDFFRNQSLLQTFAQKIRQIPDDVLSKMTAEEKKLVNESIQDPTFRPEFEDLAILPSDPEVEKEELMRKYGIKNQKAQLNNSQIEAQKQIEKFESLLKEPSVEVDEENIIRVEARKNYETDDIKQGVNPNLNQEFDPIISMFKNVKRNTDFKVNFDIENKIPRADFIEMMEDSYNTSIIEFLADEFTNGILQNPSIIRDKIVSEIKKIVYGEKFSEKIKDTAKPAKSPRRTRTKKTLNTND
jgi:hypothetical protein